METPRDWLGDPGGPTPVLGIILWLSLVTQQFLSQSFSPRTKQFGQCLPLSLRGFSQGTLCAGAWPWALPATGSQLPWGVGALPPDWVLWPLEGSALSVWC